MPRSTRAAATLALLLALAGCAPGPAAQRADAAQALGSVAESLEAASSAVATATLVVDLWRAGDLPAVTADAALGDAVGDADGATHELTTIVVPGSAVQELRDLALTAAQAGAIGVAATRTWVGGGLTAAEGEQVREDLDVAATRLEEATSAVEDAQADAT